MTMTAAQERALQFVYKKYGVGKAQTSPSIGAGSEPRLSSATSMADSVIMARRPAEAVLASNDDFVVYGQSSPDGWLYANRHYGVEGGFCYFLSTMHIPNADLSLLTEEQAASIVTGVLLGGVHTPIITGADAARIYDKGAFEPVIDPDSGIMTFALARPETSATPADSIRVACTAVRAKKLIDMEFGEKVPQYSLRDRYEAIVAPARPA